ncbi:hypothetical protein C1H57_17510 [Clostridium sp. 2-1]|uniref:hypothetical protein n=1 Tax=Clostridium TaxID=1485 RepID=UPI000CDA8E37|nr:MULTISPECIES: hypothetical protein [Clostridium]MBN7576257.1 hypothetical protein [Clostridium beijerinckii]MBN7581287.1 hypothetical protein [Clostridium beijerinckii]MBN7586026.1 hypothetical protein [Clostridium beijerinckii]MBO0521907.1 hypothetical protein [Clostridium beijerinckii]POO90056.1 hypothetical protein C1H57_17510 [Clostridium sp. 2-1]
MRKKLSVSIFLITVLIVCASYYLYPRKGTLNNFLFSNYNKENIEEIEIRSTSGGEDKTIKDKIEINDILFNLSKIKLIQHYGSISNRAKGSYHIYIYDKNSISAEVTIQGKEYISIANNINNSNKEYRIIENTLDLDYINKLISQ